MSARYLETSTQLTPSTFSWCLTIILVTTSASSLALRVRYNAATSMLPRKLVVDWFSFSLSIAESMSSVLALSVCCWALSMLQEWFIMLLARELSRLLGASLAPQMGRLGVPGAPCQAQGPCGPWGCSRGVVFVIVPFSLVAWLSLHKLPTPSALETCQAWWLRTLSLVASSIILIDLRVSLG